MKTAARLVGLALIALGAVNGHQFEMNEGLKLEEITGERINLGQQQQRVGVCPRVAPHRLLEVRQRDFTPMLRQRRARDEGRPFREVYREVGVEVKEGTFVAEERAPAPTVDLAGLRARLV